jgi:hypothetical protein
MRHLLSRTEVFIGQELPETYKNLIMLGKQQKSGQKLLKISKNELKLAKLGRIKLGKMGGKLAENCAKVSKK